MNRVVLRYADQREAKRERDAVHRAEHGAHGREPGEPRARQRQRAQEDGAEAAIRHEQHEQHADRRRERERLSGRARAPFHEHGERADAARGQRHVARGGHRRECSLQRIERLALFGGVGRGRTCLGHEQRAFASGVEPHVELAARLARRLPLA